MLRLEIQIESHQGKGTRFSVVMGRSEAPAETPASPARADARAGAMLDGMQVMCIDNDPRILDAMRLLLEGWGCRVELHGGSKSLATRPANAPAPHVVLADYHLDNESGLDVIQRLRRDHSAGLPAVLVTADRSSELRAAADRLDVTIVNKPVKPAALRTSLNRYRRMMQAAE